MRRTITLLVVLILLFGATVSYVSATRLNNRQVEVDVRVSTPWILAEETQKAYLRIGLKGFSHKNLQQRSPVNIAVVIDKSGSMGGEKIEKAKEAAILALNKLSSRDIISVILYDSTVQVLVPATRVSDTYYIKQRIRAVQAGGSTALFAGVSKGASELRKFMSPDRVNRIILLSDGLANVGPQSPEALGELGSSLGREGVSVTTIGLGTGYNEDLMTRLAFKSDGNHYFAREASELVAVFNSEFGSTLSVVAQNLVADIDCSPGVTPIRILGREGIIQGRNVQVTFNQLYGDHEKFIILEVDIDPSVVSRRNNLGYVTVGYNNMSSGQRDRMRSTVDVQFTTSPDLIEKKTDRTVMVDVIELLATERNELAIKLRDQGKIREARQALIDNSQYLNESATRYKSEKLEKYAEQNIDDAESLDKKNWQEQRKSMKEDQFQRENQQMRR